MYPFLHSLDWPSVRGWDDLELAISSLATEQERGTAFEEFCHAYFTVNKALFQARNVWRFSEVPRNILENLGSPSFQDRGIDGIICHYDNTITTYQAKFRSDRSNVPTQRELSTFFMVSDRADFRLVISNVEDLPEVVRERMDSGHILVDVLLQLPPQFFETLQGYVSTNEIRYEPPPQPKPFQERALQAIHDGFVQHSRGQAILACGSGKTLLGKWMADRLESRWILVMVPSLALIRQTLGEWHKAQTRPFRYTCVCSDPTVDAFREEDGWEIQPSDLDIKVSTQVADLVKFLLHEEPIPHVVFSTYQSGPVIVEALKESTLSDFKFDLAICDEAHRLAGVSGKAFSQILDDNLIRAQRRLFMTATPRILAPRLKKTESEEEEREPICSMDDPTQFGPEFYRFPFGQAIKERVICDYRVVVIGVTEEEIAQLVREGGTIQLEDSETWKAETLAQRVALGKAITLYEIKKVFSFHNRVLAAGQFTDGQLPESFTSVLKRMAPNLTHMTSHVSGEMATGIRSKILRQFAMSPRGVVSNARCLGEGVNVPIVDGIFFADPRESVIDIVQAVERALRLVPGKECAHIMIPILVREGEDAEQILENSKFDSVWRVLSAMASQDERLDAIIKETRIRQGEGTFPILGQSNAISSTEFVDCQAILMGFPRRIPFSEYQKLFTLEVMEKMGEGWHLRFGALKEYMQSHGDEPGKDTEFMGFKIGSWLQAQRGAYRKGKLSQDRLNLLHELPIEWNIEREDQQSWEEHLEACREFLQNEGRLPAQGEEIEVGTDIEDSSGEGAPVESQILLMAQSFSGGKLLKVGNWLTHQRQMYKKGALPQNQIELFEKTLGPVWDPQGERWERNFAVYKDYVEKTGNQPQKKTKHLGIAIGNWLTNTVRPKRNKLSVEQIQRLDALGMVWESKGGKRSPSEKWERHFAVYKDYVEKNDQQPPWRWTYHKGVLIGKWLENDVRPNKDKLSSEQVRQLEALGIDWTFCESSVKTSSHKRGPTEGAVPSSTLGGDDEEWLRHYFSFREFWKSFGTIPEPNSSYKGHQIGAWYQAQGRLYDSEALPPFKQEKFRTLREFLELSDHSRRILGAEQPEPDNSGTVHSDSSTETVEPSGASQEETPTDKLTPSTRCPTPDEEGWEEGVVPYEICSDLEPETIRNVVDPRALSKSIIKIVNIEGPIEEQLAIDRLGTLVRRFLPDAPLTEPLIHEAINKAKQSGKIFGRGNFLGAYPETPPPVRRRTDPSLARVQVISDKEIEAAMKLIIWKHGRQTQEALINKVYQSFDLVAPLSSDWDRMAGLIRHLLERGDLQEEPPGLIGLPLD